jgi:hypothetical protein
MTSQPMDFTDYLIRQQQQAWQQSQIDKLFRSDEDRDAEVARRIEDQAQDSAEGAAAAASEAEEALVEVITEARDLRKKITNGVLSPDDARHALAKLRQRHKEIAAHVPHQGRVRPGCEDHRGPSRQGRRADEPVRNLAAVS